MRACFGARREARLSASELDCLLQMLSCRDRVASSRLSHTAVQLELTSTGIRRLLNGRRVGPLEPLFRDRDLAEFEMAQSQAACCQEFEQTTSKRTRCPVRVAPTLEREVDITVGSSVHVDAV